MITMERTITPVLLAVISVAALTTVFGRRNSPAVFDAVGRGFGGAITAALGNGGKVA